MKLRTEIKYWMSILGWILRHPVKFIRNQMVYKRNKETDKIWDLLKKNYEFRVRLLNEEIKKAFKIKRVLRYRKVRIIKDGYWIRIEWIGKYFDLLVLEEAVSDLDGDLEIIGEKKVYRSEIFAPWIALSVIRRWNEK